MTRDLFFFSGRMGRSTFWAYETFLHVGKIVVIGMLGGGYDFVVTADKLQAALDEPLGAIPAGIVAIGLMGLIDYALLVKRAQDAGFASICVTMLFAVRFAAGSVPQRVLGEAEPAAAWPLAIVSLLPVIIIGLLPATSGENRFGPDPRTEQNPEADLLGDGAKSEPMLAEPSTLDAAMAKAISGRRSLTAPIASAAPRSAANRRKAGFGRRGAQDGLSSGVITTAPSAIQMQRHKLSTRL